MLGLSLGRLDYIVIFLDLLLQGFGELGPVDDIDAERKATFNKGLFNCSHVFKRKRFFRNDHKLEIRAGSRFSPRNHGTVRPNFQAFKMEAQNSLHSFQLFCF